MTEIESPLKYQRCWPFFLGLLDFGVQKTVQREPKSTGARDFKLTAKS